MPVIDEFDKKLFERLSTGGRNFKIYYQDPNADVNAPANKMGISTDKIVIEKENMRQFILPYEYFE